MADKPTTLPKWASTEETDPVSGQLNRVEPPTNRKESGWNRSEIPPRQWFNWLLWTIYKWTAWQAAGTASSTPSTVMERDANGRSKVAQPSANADAANKSYVDTGDANTLDTAKSYADGATTGEYIKWVTRGIGELYFVDDSIPGVDVPPTDDDRFRFIKLTAGEDGAGEYNEGVLISESVSGSDPEITATAVINYPDSPIDGQTIRLYNTERRFLRAGNAGATEDSQFAAHDHGGGEHSHDANGAQQGGDEPHNSSGNFTASAGVPGGGTYNETDVIQSADGFIDSEGGDETRPRNAGVTYYMRIA